ncbi:MAG: hypothetical protein NC247_02190 [Ruminococcus flavefaciens]|nr:hypothetical protein [Ruminococcus flavefaciens]
MFIGERIETDGIMEVAEITNIVPVKNCDDGDEQWYEVCDTDKTNLAAIIVKDSDGVESSIIINKDTAGIQLLVDLL